MKTPVPDRRRLIDRKALVAALNQALPDQNPAEQRAALLAALREALESGRAEVRRRLENRVDGVRVARAGCYLVDQIIRILFDFTLEHAYPVQNPTEAEHLALVAVGGYGRGELAPFSDIDLLFLLPYKQTAWGEQVVEYMLYILWDLGLKVGYSVRTVKDCLRLARQDLTIRTALLEARFLWGDQRLYKELATRFSKEVVAGTGPDFIEAKLAERDERHHRMGDTRYVVEPNLKEGKGGLRDLHTLFWIGKYVYQVSDTAQLVDKGVLSHEEYNRFARAERFLWTVRCHLHQITGRPEERLTFDVQRTLASWLGYVDRAGVLGVERFMKHYFLTAKDIGDLTRIFCAHLEHEHARKTRLRLPRFGLRKREIEGFLVEGNRLSVEDKRAFSADPVRMIELFAVAQQRDFDIHPQALRLITRALKRINGAVRRDPRANALLLQILTSRKDPAQALLRMNEAGVLGRMIPEFGRVVAQMQYDMYHHFTVDEHTIHAIGVLARIEAGELGDEHPVSHKVIHQLVSRRVLYCAVFLHDIAKGRRCDHSKLGADIARSLCPRLGLEAAETETVAWLVRHHLMMSDTAFKRDVTDPKTVADFAAQVQSLERLRLLLVLTVADIRAVGPGVWNGWKGQLLRDLYYRTEEVLSGGHSALGSAARLAAAREQLRARLSDWPDAVFESYAGRFYDPYWLVTEPARQEADARFIRQADEAGQAMAMTTRADSFRAVTEVTLYAQDHPGLFARLAGAMAVSGASIVDAKIFTTRDGMAFDSFWIQDSDGGAFDDARKLARLRTTIERTLAGELRPHEVLARKPALVARTRVFTVAPVVLVDNKASDVNTVIEINGRDRPGLLCDLTRALYDLSLSIASAHIATYGERAVDVFYVRDLFGHKIHHPRKIERIEQRLLDALREPAEPAEPAAVG